MNMNEMKVFIRMPDVIKATGQSRSTIRRGVKAQTFLAPFTSARTP